MEVKVNLKRGIDNSYCIFIGKNVIEDLNQFVNKKFPRYNVVLITDNNVKKLYGKKITIIIDNIDVLSIQPGEKSKSRETKAWIEDYMLNKKYGRDTLIISLGGGVVGDLAGFVASTFNRGIPLIHVPTTLLAMVDSSIGGKTGLNTSQGKNLIGTIWQPKAIFTDIVFLKTLSKNELKSALAEIIKHAIILDSELFDFVEKEHQSYFNKKEDVLLKIIEKNCRIKASVVERDEFENDYRAIVNFGHTISHAIEALSNYKMSHGEALAIGIIIESLVSNKLGLIDNLSVDRIKKLIINTGFNTKLDKNITAQKIINQTRLDKKTRKGISRYVLIEKIGRIKSQKNKFAFEVPDNLLKKVIKDYKNEFN